MAAVGNKWKFCKQMACDKLQGANCTAETCQYPDIQKALNDKKREA